MELVFLTSPYALLQLTPIMALSDAQMALSAQTSMIVQAEESAHQLLQSSVMTETANNPALNALLMYAQAV